jgi:uncharacterized protein with NRDE domain
MCISLIAYKYHPDYPLIILSNRDEYHSRPTLSAHFWREYPDILAGKDLYQGGSWLGINKNGKITLLTNYRAPGQQDPQKRSRGQLPDTEKKDFYPYFYKRSYLRHKDLYYYFFGQ